MNTITAIRRLAIIGAVVTLSACQMGGASADLNASTSETLTGTCHYGAILVEQSTAADTIYDNHTDRRQRFFKLYEGVQSDGISPVVGDEVVVFLRHNKQRVHSYRAVLKNGIIRASAPCAIIRPNTGVCVEVPQSWGKISRQTRFPQGIGDRLVMCNEDRYSYFKNDGRSPARASGVNAMKPRAAVARDRKKREVPTS